MKILHLIRKSFREQVRSYWILILTLSMGPFFVFVYFLITETSKPQYRILLVNNDTGLIKDNSVINHGALLEVFLKEARSDTAAAPFTTESIADRDAGIYKVKDKKADALIVIGNSFSSAINGKGYPLDSLSSPDIEFIGDLTSTNYLISAVWASEVIRKYVDLATGNKDLIKVIETPLGISGSVNYFDYVVPGLLIVSLIMLMFTASIAFVSEAENRTIIRLKMSRLSAAEFVGGISLVQLIIGIASILLTLLVATLLGFHFKGSLLIMIVIGSFTSLSLIAFSLIIAGITKSANEVLVVGNFPMFLFMFFTGAAFPLNSEALFTIKGYPVNIQSLMSPTHAISALNKTFVMNMGIKEIIPEIIALVILTIIYFAIGAVLFKNKHLKMS